ncbi:RNA 2',3'-cyclic phosphodiesterase [Bacteroidetes/Chlorobi group bacterium ChocPot_Mid]|nr:MAG: RNA 2',3'-cyclic phosphodiesterase [Bacteroidetes/Chlorobi group bacterium ChocPot_Mid]
MEKKRLFIGTFIKSDTFFEGYKKIVNEFSGKIYGKWVELENLHFTYKFIGDVDIEKVPELISTIDCELREFNSNFILKGLGIFPNVKNPRVFFVNIINSDRRIFEIYKTIEDKLTRIGYEKEKREFRPHLTLLRVKSVTAQFQSILPKFANVEFALVNKFYVNLIESQLTPKGPIYTIIK